MESSNENGRTAGPRWGTACRPDWRPASRPVIERAGAGSSAGVASRTSENDRKDPTALGRPNATTTGDAAGLPARSEAINTVDLRAMSCELPFT